jgi:hypothetical protein
MSDGGISDNSMSDDSTSDGGASDDVASLTSPLQPHLFSAIALALAAPVAAA